MLCVCVRAVCDSACHGKGLVALASQLKLNLVEFDADATVKA